MEDFIYYDYVVEEFEKPRTKPNNNQYDYVIGVLASVFLSLALLFILFLVLLTFSYA